MSLAQRIRDSRYSKGWGPDELANRAEISRTALYQIESGKTELPRAGTLRRIAVALEVPMEELLGNGAEQAVVSAPIERHKAFRSRHGTAGWNPMEEHAVRVKAAAAYTGISPSMGDDSRHALEPLVKARPQVTATPFAREGELMSKLHVLLQSPLGDCITGIVDDLHDVLMQVARAS